MSFKEEEIDRFDRFSEGRMPSAEAQDFLKEVETQPELAARFKEYKLLTDAIVELGREDVAQLVSSWEREAASEKKTSKRYLLIAAAVSLLIVSSVTIWLQTSSNDVANFFHPYPDVLTSRGEVDPEINTAMNAYNQRNYQSALPHFDRLSEKTGRPIFSLYAANCLMAEDAYESAAQRLEELNNKPTPQIKEDIEWYLCLAYLGIDSQQKLQEMIDLILKNDQHSYYEQVIALQQNLNLTK